MSTCQPGEKVPEAQLTAAGGEPVFLRQLLGGKIVVLYFYPKDETPGCTVEACGFRDAYHEFLDAGAEVIGVSEDSPESHQQFIERYHLPFTLLSDPGGAAAKAMGVKRTLGLLPGRTTFVIDRQGVVRLRFDSQVRVKRHVKDALELVERLNAQGA